MLAVAVLRHEKGDDVKSKADKLRLDQIHNMPCMLCVEIKKDQPSPTEGHHLVDFGYREHSGGDQATLPLCRDAAGSKLGQLSV